MSLPGLRVLIFGLGTFGGGLGVARFFSERGAEVTVTDLQGATTLASSIAQLEDCAISRWRLGEHRLEDFEECDWVVVNSAVRPDNEYLRKARQAGARVVTEMGLFLRWCPSMRVTPFASIANNFHDEPRVGNPSPSVHGLHGASSSFLNLAFTSLAPMASSVSPLSRRRDRLSRCI